MDTINDSAERIQQALTAIEQEKHIRILYACESGSRAWGFASADSDYDVRFIYVRPTAAYLRLDVPRDVIERPIADDLDISGWDIFKALRLLRKSNPPLLEWLFSPIRYVEVTPQIGSLRQIARSVYSSTAVYFHYRQMARGNYHQYIEGKSPVLIKKYLYVLRPLVALCYLKQHGHLPPTSFIETLGDTQLDDEVYEHIHLLVERKRRGEELGMGAPDPVLNAFIAVCLDQFATPLPEQHRKRQEFRMLDDVLATILEEVAL